MNCDVCNGASTLFHLVLREDRAGRVAVFICDYCNHMLFNSKSQTAEPIGEFVKRKMEAKTWQN